MSKVSNNPLLVGASGKLGDTIVFKQWQGTLVMANKAKKRVKISAKQKESSVDFRKAVTWAKKMMAIPEKKAEYEKRITPAKNAAYRVALTDYMTAPVVHYVHSKEYSGAVGETITIKATDDFKVTKVVVTIKDAMGVLIEQGDAIQHPRKRFMWKHQTTVLNSTVAGTEIKAVAHDNPGNKTEMILKF